MQFKLLKKSLSLFISFCFFFITTSPAFAQTRIEVPTGKIVPVVLRQPQSSENLRKGDIIPIAVAQDVKESGHIIFKRGAEGIAYVENVTRKGHHGRAGFVEIRQATVNDVSGRQHTLQLNIEDKGESRRPSAILFSVIGVGLILIPFGIWRQGTEAYISSGRIFNGILSTGADININQGR